MSDFSAKFLKSEICHNFLTILVVLVIILPEEQVTTLSRQKGLLAVSEPVLFTLGERISRAAETDTSIVQFESKRVRLATNLAWSRQVFDQEVVCGLLFVHVADKPPRSCCDVSLLQHHSAKDPRFYRLVVLFLRLRTFDHRLRDEDVAWQLPQNFGSEGTDESFGVADDAQRRQQVDILCVFQVIRHEVRIGSASRRKRRYLLSFFGIVPLHQLLVLFDLCFVGGLQPESLREVELESVSLQFVERLLRSDSEMCVTQQVVDLHYNY